VRGLAALAAALAPAALAGDIGEGNWEMSVTTHLPGARPATVTQTRCLRAADGRNPAQLFGSPGPGCEFRNQRDDGRVYRFEILCRDQNASVSGTGEIAYGADRLNGELALRTAMQGQALDLRTKIDARRVGPCP
jgi:hypothetical protein